MKAMNTAALVIALGSVLACPTASAAYIWTENAAGELISSAEVVTGAALHALDGIRGTLATSLLLGAPGPRNEVDVYKIFIDNAPGFSARTVSSNPFDDTALFLFSGSGNGVFMNDDNGFDLLSALPDVDGVGGIGFYYLAVAIGGFAALDAAANSVFLAGVAGVFTDVLDVDPASGALAAWSERFTTLADPGLAYDIVLTGARVAQIPEPTSLALLGLAGFAAWRARRPSAPLQALA